MQSTSDIRLLRDYAAHGSEAAFAELVHRHADLDYSAALRQVDSPDLAHDVTQAVFTDLGRKASTLAASLPDEASLVGWLYRGTRYEALTLRRGEQRRRQRELLAMETSAPAPETPIDWDALRPCLDDAMDKLEPADRDALLLRYFENKDLRTVGAALGVSDDVAQKRVTRAVDKLRALLASRGVTTSAAGLTGMISAQAVHAAPAGLTAALVSLSATGIATGAATTTTAVATLAMTTTQKLLVGGVLTVALGTGVFEAREAGQLRRELATLRQDHAPLAARLAELEADRAKISNLVASLNAENDRLQALATDGLKLHQHAVQLADKTQREVAGTDPDIQEAMKWKAKKEKLQQLFRDNPDWWVPEVALITETEWLDAARLSDLESAAGVAHAKQEARAKGERKYIQGVAAAVVRFMNANDQSLPESLAKVGPYFQGPGEAAWLERYRIVQTEHSPHLPPGPGWRITQARDFDPDGDVRLGMNLLDEGGFGTTETRTNPVQ